MERVSREAIIELMTALEVELTRQGIECELVLMGGAAMVLRHGARETTKDIDAVVVPETRKQEVLEAAARVASDHGLPDDWLNDAAKGYLQGLDVSDPIWQRGSLVVRVVSDEQLLAMKLCAWRDDLDISDARLLLNLLSGSREEVFSRIRPFLVPGRELRAQYAFDDLWEADRGCA